MRAMILASTLATLLAGCPSSGTTNAPPPSASQDIANSAMTAPAKTASTPRTTASSASTSAAVSTADGPTHDPNAPPDALKQAADGNRDFAAAVYKLPTATGNRLISPLSIRLAFAMAYAGAKGETATEMAKALNLKGAPEKVHDAFREALADLNARNALPNHPPVLRVVNRIWGQTGRAFTPEFKATLDVKYGAPLETLDFTKDAEGARARINGWVAEKTEQKIKDLIAPGALSGATPLVLTNAVYFKAAWANPFYPSNTKADTFYADGTRTVKTPLMHSTGKREYLETKDATVLRMPYADNSLSMVFVLPKAKNGLKAIEASLKGSDFAAWTASAPTVTVAVTLPKFKFEGELSGLAETMQSLGMKRAFKRGEADFSGMDGTNDLFIGAAVHKSFIDLDEKGTEAAAATAVYMPTGAAPKPETPKPFVADHPFLFFIHDQKTDTVLFVGRVTDPSGKS